MERKNVFDLIVDLLPGVTLESAREDSLYFRVLESGPAGGLAIAVYPLGFGNTQLALVSGYGAIEDCYYYATPAQAIEAAKSWSGAGEPMAGWHRHPPSGRRREGGDPAKETVRP